MSTTTHQPGNFVSYTIGFVLSVFFTVLAYLVVTEKLVAGWSLVGAVMTLAIAQLLVQLICFLHIGREAKPRWNLLAFLFMALILLVIALGSLWIMHNLNYHMSPKDMTHYIDSQGDL
jgi:cytochrome o ubiquinol oxidase operon protein cyoD